MKLFFSPTPISSELPGFIPQGKNTLYLHYVEYGTGPGELLDVTIHDSIGRYVPVNIRDIDDLIVALNKVREMAKVSAVEPDRLAELTNPEIFTVI